MKYYQINTSTGGHIKIDENDLNKFIANCDSGKFIKLKKAIVNPSFVTEILPILQQEALNEEERPKIAGYVDEKTRTFKVTTPKEIIDTNLKDEFSL